MKRFGLLGRLLIGIIAGVLLGSLGLVDSVGTSNVFRFFLRITATFTSLFSSFLGFLIPLIIVSFVSVGLGDLGKKANKMFGVTLLLAYSTTV